MPAKRRSLSPQHLRPSESHPAEFLINRVLTLQEDKTHLLATIQEEKEAHQREVARLKERIAVLKEGEAMLLEKHRELMQKKVLSPRGKSEELLLATGAHLTQKQRELEDMLADYVARSNMHAAYLPIGTEVRVRDSHSEEWKYGRIAQYEGMVPLVQLAGWEKLLSWSIIEPRPV